MLIEKILKIKQFYNINNNGYIFVLKTRFIEVSMRILFQKSIKKIYSLIITQIKFSKTELRHSADNNDRIIIITKSRRVAIFCYHKCVYYSIFSSNTCYTVKQYK